MEPVLANPSAAEATAARLRETAEAARETAQRLGQRLENAWEQASERVAETVEQIPALKRELRRDAEYVARRARHYHQTRPLNALGFVAAAAFVLGLAIGLGRR